MNITYRREMKHNFMIIEPEDAGYDSYEMHMLAANGIDGLLKFRLKQKDNHKFYYYEITSKQPLNRVLEYQSLSQEELKKLISGITQILGRLERYLLLENQILLKPEYIYLEPERFTVFLCLVPGRQGDFPGEMTGLLRYLLGKVNHQEKECVVMAYGLYQESLKENYGMNDLLEIIGKNSAYTDKKNLMDIEEMHKTENHQEMVSSNTEETDAVPKQVNHAEKKSNFNFSKIGSAMMVSSASAFGITALIWFFLGASGILNLCYVPVAVGVVSMLVILLYGGKEVCLQKEQENRKVENTFWHQEPHDWQMTFEEETKEEEPEKEEEVFQTVLLTEPHIDKNVKYLRATVPDIEDIAISYVPFLIGKQEGLVDYVLDKEIISRIHVRIDKEGEEYRISDLNSTNGTSVNGRLLETNETAVLKSGDEVALGNFGFIFT